MDVMRAGAVIVAGTDTPNAINLHGELAAYVAAGMTPYEALKAATVNPAQALALDAGTIEAGKLADLVIVDGDPLANVANAHKVRRVIANGRVYEMEQLIKSGSVAEAVDSSSSLTSKEGGPVSRLRIVVLVALVVARRLRCVRAAGLHRRCRDGRIKAVLPGRQRHRHRSGRRPPDRGRDQRKGEYRLQNMPPGKYAVQAELSGFSTVDVQGRRAAGRTERDDPVHASKLASVTETLTVVGETPLVDTTSSQVAGNVDRRQMEQLPLQGRNWMELSKLVKGVTANDVGNSIGTGAMDDLWQLNLDGQQITQKVAGSGLRSAEVQPRVDRRVPDRHQHVRHHAGAIGRHGNPGDFQVGHEQLHRQHLRLLPQRLVQLRGSGGQESAAVLEPAGRRDAGRADREGQGPFLRVV